MSISEEDRTTIGTALVICERPLDPDRQRALVDALGAVGVSCEVHSALSLQDVRHVVHKCAATGTQHDLFLCVVLAADGARFTTADQVQLDVEAEVVAPLSDASGPAAVSMRNAANVFLTNAACSGAPDSTSPVDARPRSLLAYTVTDGVGSGVAAEDTTDTVLVDSLVSALTVHEVAAASSDRKPLDLKQVLRAIGGRSGAAGDSQQQQSPPQGQGRSPFRYRCFDLDPRKVLLQANTNRTLRRWLLGGVLFGVHRHRRNRSIRIRAADILPICRYVSRFVRLLYVYDVRDLDSLFAHRGQYERVEDLTHDLDSDMAAAHAAALFDLLHCNALVPSAFGCAVALRHTHGLLCGGGDASQSGSVSGSGGGLSQRRTQICLGQLAECLCAYLGDCSGGAEGERVSFVAGRIGSYRRSVVECVVDLAATASSRRVLEAMRSAVTLVSQYTGGGDEQTLSHRELLAAAAQRLGAQLETVPERAAAGEAGCDSDDSSDSGGVADGGGGREDEQSEVPGELSVVDDDDDEEDGGDESDSGSAIHLTMMASSQEEESIANGSGETAVDEATTSSPNGNIAHVVVGGSVGPVGGSQSSAAKEEVEEVAEDEGEDIEDNGDNDDDDDDDDEDDNDDDDNDDDDDEVDMCIPSTQVAAEDFEATMMLEEVVEEEAEETKAAPADREIDVVNEEEEGVREEGAGKLVSTGSPQATAATAPAEEEGSLSADGTILDSATAVTQGTQATQLVFSGATQQHTGQTHHSHQTQQTQATQIVVATQLVQLSPQTVATAPPQRQQQPEPTQTCAATCPTQLLALTDSPPPPVNDRPATSTDLSLDKKDSSSGGQLHTKGSSSMAPSQQRNTAADDDATQLMPPPLPRTPLPRTPLKTASASGAVPAVTSLQTAFVSSPAPLPPSPAGSAFQCSTQAATKGSEDSSSSFQILLAPSPAVAAMAAATDKPHPLVPAGASSVVLFGSSASHARDIVSRHSVMSGPGGDSSSSGGSGGNFHRATHAGGADDEWISARPAPQASYRAAAFQAPVPESFKVVGSGSAVSSSGGGDQPELVKIVADLQPSSSSGSSAGLVDRLALQREVDRRCAELLALQRRLAECEGAGATVVDVGALLAEQQQQEQAVTATSSATDTATGGGPAMASPPSKAAPRSTPFMSALSSPAHVQSRPSAPEPEPLSATGKKKLLKRKFVNSPSGVSASSPLKVPPAASAAVSTPAGGKSLFDMSSGGSSIEEDFSDGEEREGEERSKTKDKAAAKRPPVTKAGKPTVPRGGAYSRGSTIPLTGNALELAAMDGLGGGGGGDHNDDEDEVSEAEAEFDEPMVVAAVAVSSGALAAERDASRIAKTPASAEPASSAATTTAVAAANSIATIPDYLPSQFFPQLLQQPGQQSSFPPLSLQRWSTELWAALEALSWYWAKGKGLVDFFYVRPGCRPVSGGGKGGGFSLGIHYFTSEEEVLRFLREEVRKHGGRVDGSGSSSSGGGGLLLKHGGGALKRKNEGTDDDDDDDVVFTFDSSAEKKVKAATPRDSPTTVGSTSVVAFSRNAGGASSSAATTTVTKTTISPPKAPLVPAIPDVRTMLWRDLWGLLRPRGWTWDFGSGNVRSLYFAPGFDKRSRDAALNRDKFESEEAVRRFVRKQKLLKVILTPLSTADVTVTAVPASTSVAAPAPQSIMEASEAEAEAESQAESQAVDPEQWSLMAHRKRRKVTPSAAALQSDMALDLDPGDGDWREGDDEEEGEEMGENEGGEHGEGAAVHATVEPVAAPKNAAARKATPVRPAPRRQLSPEPEQEQERETAEEDLAATQAQALPSPSPVSPVRASTRAAQWTSGSLPTTAPAAVAAVAAVAASSSSSSWSYSSVHPRTPFRQNTATTVAVPSSSSVRKSGAAAAVRSMLFAGLNFVVSGFDEKDEIVEAIRRNSGTVLDAVPVNSGHLSGDSGGGNDDSQFTAADADDEDEFSGRRLILVSHPKEFRKRNYLMALATGARLVHFKWVRDCLAARSLVGLDGYCLTSGADPTRPCFVMPEVFPPPRGGVLARTTVLNLAGRVWAEILTAAGADLVAGDRGRLVEQLARAITGRSADESASSSGRKPPPAPRVDLVLVDPYEYSQNVAARLQRTQAQNSRGSSRLNSSGGGGGRSGEASRPQEGGGGGGGKLSDAELDLVECLCCSGSAGSSSLALPAVVTTDWAVHCLATARRGRPDLVDIFSLPPGHDPVRAPFAFKAGPERGGERYSKYDAVYFRRNSSSSSNSNGSNTTAASDSEELLCLGQIRKFSRRNVDCPLQVKVRPLRVSNPLASDSGSGGGSAVKRTPQHHQHHHQQQQSDATDEWLVGKELCWEPGAAELMVDATMLAGKVVILEKDAFLHFRQYAAADRDVYYAGPDLAAQGAQYEPGVAPAGVSQDDQGAGGSSRKKIKIRRSQDY